MKHKLGAISLKKSLTFKLCCDRYTSILGIIYDFVFKLTQQGLNI